MVSQTRPTTFPYFLQRAHVSSGNQDQRDLPAVGQESLHMRHVSSMGEIQDFQKSVISVTLMTRVQPPPPSEFHFCKQARGTNSTLSAVGCVCGTSTQILLSRIHFLAKNQVNINKVIRRSMCNWEEGGGRDADLGAMKKNQGVYVIRRI